ncbi:hypothetical protein E2C01_042614 [Portunus trituberculatus]|uniref:Uncharacterized protein n=1 Tax=Portunus trituberculatus TaxID=210409 RepID=A0A5B7FU32_PORTR|nr:hypothetical protein [Portunus trituberculatus]
MVVGGRRALEGEGGSRRGSLEMRGSGRDSRNLQICGRLFLFCYCIDARRSRVSLVGCEAGDRYRGVVVAWTLVPRHHLAARVLVLFKISKVTARNAVVSLTGAFTIGTAAQPTANKGPSNLASGARWQHNKPLSLGILDHLTQFIGSQCAYMCIFVHIHEYVLVQNGAAGMGQLGAVPCWEGVGWAGLEGEGLSGWLEVGGSVGRAVLVGNLAANCLLPSLVGNPTSGSWNYLL